jgi:hypothetical protein
LLRSHFSRLFYGRLSASVVVDLEEDLENGNMGGSTV